MSVLSQDRTAEFRSAVKVQLHGLNQRTPTPVQQVKSQSARSQFMKQASTVAQDIASTTQILQRLAQLAKRRRSFDDKPQEIAELTIVVKQKVNVLKNNITSLDQQTKELGGTKKTEQADTMSRNVVVSLQGKLQQITGDFTKVLKERSSNIQSNRTRADQIIAPRQPAPISNPLYQENPFAPNMLGSEYGSQEDQLLLPSQEQSTILLEDQQTGYLTQRSSAVDAIESTINELGNMFSQLSHMIAEQRDTVQRIDMNTEDISLNVEGAHRELLKFYSRVSSNRGLMLKSFAIIICMFLVWMVIN